MRAKMYSLLNNDEQKNKMTAKGISRRVISNSVSHQSYKKCLEPNYLIQLLKGVRIRSTNHNLKTEKYQKKGLSPFNDKIFLDYIEKEKKFVSHSFGHYSCK